MNYRQITYPTAQVITTQEAFNHLRLDITGDADQIGYVTSLVNAAVAYCQSYQRRCYLLTTWEAYLNEWPRGIVMIEKSPVVSVDNIQYRDAAGVWQTLSTDLYRTDTISEPALIAFLPDLPTADLTAFNSIRITFQSGYVNGQGAQDINLIPENVKAAIMLIIGHLYEHREQVVMGTIQTNMDFGVDTLLDVGRVFVF